MKRGEFDEDLTILSEYNFSYDEDCMNLQLPFAKSHYQRSFLLWLFEKKSIKKKDIYDVLRRRHSEDKDAARWIRCLELHRILKQNEHSIWLNPGWVRLNKKFTRGKKHE